MKKKRFCNICGSTLTQKAVEGKERELCSKCGHIHYENPLPVVSVIVVNEKREALLVLRDREPFRNMWCFPIGFAETGESVEEAALRELHEETGIEGRIVQLVDAGSHKNDTYGDLLIVTFEVEATGGEMCPGDDAAECRYFPVMNLPKLAFDSQQKALERFVRAKKDLWSIHDSMEEFVESTRENRIVYPGSLLSDGLIAVVEGNAGRIIQLWLDDVTTNPSTPTYQVVDREDLRERATQLLRQFPLWLRDQGMEGLVKDFYGDLGSKRREQGVPLAELISSISLLKKHIWMFTYSFGIWEKALDIYRMFELGERLVYFFDRALYYAAWGYSDRASRPA